MNMIRNLLRWVRVTKPGLDIPSKFHIQQIEYLGKLGDALMIFPYGLHANLPENSFGVMFSIQGNPDNRGVIAWVPKGRPKLEGGEVAFYHPPTDAFMIWRENGDLDIKTGNDGTSKINITSDNVTITAPTVTINGDLIVTGSTTLSNVVTSNSKDISDTHTHTGDSGGTTGPPL